MEGPTGVGKMSGFEALFAFYALLLGLAVANVTTGFADMYRSRRVIAIGWTVPLLGCVVLLSACQQWIALFSAQDMALGVLEVLTCLGMALPYIFVSRAMTPRDGEATPLEVHYAEHRLVLAGMLLVPLATSLAVNVTYSTILNEWSAQKIIALLLYLGIRAACIIPMLIWPAAVVQRAGLIALGACTALMMF